MQFPLNERAVVDLDLVEMIKKWIETKRTIKKEKRKEKEKHERK